MRQLRELILRFGGFFNKERKDRGMMREEASTIRHSKMAMNRKLARIRPKTDFGAAAFTYSLCSQTKD